MPLVRTSLRLISWSVFAAAAAAAAGVAEIRGLLPELPWGANAQLRSYTQAAADRLGIKLGAPANPAVGPREAAAPGGQTGPRPPGAGQAAAPPGGPRPTGPGGGGGGPPPVPVKIGKAERMDVPVRFEAIGTVQPLASVVLRSRVDSQIVQVEVQDGARVESGSLLFRLDSRQIEAQIRQAEGNLKRNQAQLELAELDVKRKETLARAESTSRALLDTARGNVAMMKAQIEADTAVLENLKVIRSYYEVRAPISGRIGVAPLKIGSMARPGDGAPALVTINQMRPIYVAFPVPQRLLIELREAVANGTGKVSATPQGLSRSAEGGIVVVLDNAVDGATATIMARARFDNDDELLWPGSLVNIRLTLRIESSKVVVDREAVQTGQDNSFVFVVVDGRAQMRPVVVGRTIDGKTVIEDGLTGGETVITDGQLRVTNGSRVMVPSARPPGAQPPGPGGPRPPGQGPAAPTARQDGTPPAGRPPA
jgi:RND family efflux transporter MFP subunit